MSDLELRHLRYLIVVAETGSITRAAQRLLITQPALSRAIRALERTVGVDLFVRGPHSTRLTAAGSALLAEAYEMMERNRTALERARGARPGAETLTVTAPECDVVAVAAAGRAFEIDHPGVRVDVVPRDFVSQPDELRAGAAHVSFLRDSYDRHDLVVDRLAQEPRLVMLRADHPLAGRERLAVSDLRDEPVTHWAGMTAGQAEHWTGADVHGRPRRAGPAVRSTADVLAAVVLGRAIAFAHGSTLPGALPGIRIRPVDGLSASRLEIGIPARSASSTAKRFVEHVRRRWAPEES
ncbi:LysR family transcriptional regulator [Dactylosporangium sp. CA-092794]|uniref:LysR family transcriptional regulator n=1 Tax=Dactylosporangium sp. CA-092794 TaxID=3239929 RepID=UPI003D932F57